MIGTSIGSYRITAKLGAGGMGEVYRARDTKLDRDVAIKILPDSFAHDAERVARFEREAKVLAALNHPNIAQIYGLEERALVMELVEGSTLAERIAQGALPLDEALNIAKQIAEALEAAHEKGITHRDLKPANVKITPAGVVKVLDFGLATAAQSSTPDGNPSISPTLTLDYAATRAGMIMGTAAYMSPEQASGKTVDKRSDIWSFGVVLWEMLTGKRLFDGETISHVMADVLKGEIDFGKLPKQTPPAIQNLLPRCLDRDVKTRLRDIGEARICVQNYLSDPVRAEPVNRRTTSRRGLKISFAAICVVAVLLAGFLYLRAKPLAPGDVVRLQFLPPNGNRLAGIPVLSPDGRHLAFEAMGADRQYRLWVHDMASVESRVLPHTENELNPFWSPDSRFLAFYANGRLKKIEVSGGPAIDLCSAVSSGRGGSWNRDGVIIFGTGSGIMRVSANGGDPVPVTKLDKAREEIRHARPEFLPDGVHFLYVRSTKMGSGIYIGSLDAKPENQSTKLLLRAEIAPLFAPSRDAGLGYVLFMRDQALMAQGFDTGRFQLVDEPVQIADPVSSNGIAGTFSVSENGMLAYVGDADLNFNTELEWYDRQGKVLGTVGQPGHYRSLSISPDGSRAAVDRSEAGGAQHIWIFELGRNVSTRLTSGKSTNSFATWSPDSRHLVFESSKNGGSGLYSKPASGLGEEQLLLDLSNFPVILGLGSTAVLTDLSRNGRFLLLSMRDSSAKSHLWTLPLEGNRRAEPLTKSEFNETQGRFSPDSHWIAFTSDESGGSEVYIQSVPATPSGAKQIVSVGGGSQPHWRSDGKELYYLSGDDKFMAVDINTSPLFKSGTPRQLFRADLYGGADQTRHRWDVAPDGTRFLINTGTGFDAAPPPITIVLNWPAELKK